MTAVALHVGQLLQPVPGGIGTYVRALLVHVPGSGVTLSAFAAGPRPASVTVPYTDLGWPRGALRYEAWARLHRPRLALEADVLHASSLALPPTRLRTGRRAALVVTVHDVAFLRHPEFFTARGIAFHRRALDQARSHADIVITPSEFTRTELGREGFDLDRVVAIPHGITPPDHMDDAAVASTLSRLGIAGPFVLSVGTVEPRKGLDTAAAAVAHVRATHPDVTLVIAGPTGWSHVPDLDRPYVRRLGTVPEHDLDALYAGAAVCVVPSRYEGFGLPALEAMARGCPVIASDTSGLAEVLGGAGIGVPPGDTAAWSDAISLVIDDPEQRATLAGAGRARAAEFTWAGAAAAHRNAYIRAAGHASAGRS